jgi:hypothetical protein
MVNLSDGEQRAILSFSLLIIWEQSNGGDSDTYIGFKDTVGDWLTGFEIVLHFFVESKIQSSFFRFGETVACMVNTVVQASLAPDFVINQLYS